MHLKVIPSKCCSIHQIKLPEHLRIKLDLDYGDWLVFDTIEGEHSVQVAAASLEDTVEFGDRYAFVSEFSPVLSSKSSDIYIEPHELTIGCDPELFLIDKKTKKLVLAHKILKNESQLGSDGDLAELRPDYALSPEQLIINIKKLISQIPIKVPPSLFPYASSWHAYRCCGFHVHLGLPIELLSFAAEKTNELLKNIVAVLDYFVGIPAAFTDPDNNRRFNKEYGKPGDYRLSMRTLEYRTPGGFHLGSPLFTKKLLYSSFEIMDVLIHDIEEATDYWRDTSQVINFEYFMEKYQIPSKEVIKAKFLSKDREELKSEKDKVCHQLTNLLDEDYKFIMKEETKNENSLLYNWLEIDNEKKSTVYLH